MISITEYIDTEAEFVKCLRSALQDPIINATNVRVATRRLPETHRGSLNEVILRSNGGTPIGNRIEESFTITIWVYGKNENEAYADAQALTNKVMTAVGLSISKGDHFRAVLVGPNNSPVEDEGTTQVRMITTTLLHFGTIKRLTKI